MITMRFLNPPVARVTVMELSAGLPRTVTRLRVWMLQR